MNFNYFYFTSRFIKSIYHLKLINYDEYVTTFFILKAKEAKIRDQMVQEELKVHIAISRAYDDSV